MSYEHLLWLAVTCTLWLLRFEARFGVSSSWERDCTKSKSQLYRKTFVKRIWNMFVKEVSLLMISYKYSLFVLLRVNDVRIRLLRSVSWEVQCWGEAANDSTYVKTWMHCAAVFGPQWFTAILQFEISLSHVQMQELIRVNEEEWNVEVVEGCGVSSFKALRILSEICAIEHASRLLLVAWASESSSDFPYSTLRDHVPRKPWLTMLTESPHFQWGKWGGFGFLRVDCENFQCRLRRSTGNEKMSKSLGNFVGTRDLQSHHIAHLCTSCFIASPPLVALLRSPFEMCWSSMTERCLRGWHLQHW